MPIMKLYCQALKRFIYSALNQPFQDINIKSYKCTFFRLHIIEIELSLLSVCLCTCVHVFPQACRDFLDLAETHSRRWQRALQYEREQRTHLEETIEQLAKQHNSLERAWREAPTLASSTPSAPTTNKGETDCLCYLLLWASVQTSPHWLKVMCDLRLSVTNIPHFGNLCERRIF